MKKKELVKTLMERMQKFGYFPSFTNVKVFIREYEKMTKPEPQKPVVPQFVADWIEYVRGWNKGLLYALANASDEVLAWLCVDKLKRQELFARAWLDGYEVEKEKRYYVRFKGMESGDFNYLNFIKFQHAWVLSSIKLDKKFRTEHTKKQLEEAGFGWVFDCEGIEIEEVEE